MRRFAAIIGALFFSALSPWLMNVSPADAQVACNDRSGFLKSYGPIKLGDILAIGPDCQHAQDGLFTGQGVIPVARTVSIDIPSDIFQVTAHGFALGTPLIFTTTGALPTGILPIPVNSNPVAVYAIPVTADQFRVATTSANAHAGIAINVTGTQSGIHTVIANGVACAGCIGEAIWNVVPLGSCVTFPTASGGVTWNSITVPPGIWAIGTQTGVISSNAPDLFTHMHASFDQNITSITTSPGGGDVTAAHITSNNKNGWIFGGNLKTMFYSANATLNANATADYAPGVNTGCFYGTAIAIRRH